MRITFCFVLVVSISSQLGVAFADARCESNEATKCVNDKYFATYEDCRLWVEKGWGCKSDIPCISKAMADSKRRCSGTQEDWCGMYAASVCKQKVTAEPEVIEAPPPKDPAPPPAVAPARNAPSSSSVGASLTGRWQSSGKYKGQTITIFDSGNVMYSQQFAGGGCQYEGKGQFSGNQFKNAKLRGSCTISGKTVQAANPVLKCVKVSGDQLSCNVSGGPAVRFSR